jgi:integrase
MAHFYKYHGSWRLILYKDGRRQNLSLGADINRAKALKASIELACQNDKFKQNLLDTLVEMDLIQEGGMSVKTEGIVTWEDARNKLLGHLKNIGRAKHTIEIYEAVLKSIEDILKPVKPSDINTHKADQWIETLLNTPNKNDKAGTKKRKSSGVNAQVRTAKAAFQRFMRWEYVAKNPFHNCEMPKIDLSLPRPMTEEEASVLLKASNRPLRRVIEILIHSGMRPDELFNLTWKRVIFGKNPYVHIIRDGNWVPKAHTERMIPMSESLINAFGRPGNPEDYVAGRNEFGFVINRNWLERAFKRAVKRAGLSGKKITVYCCRDTYATNLAIEGHQAHVIAARLGHRDVSTSMKYVSFVRLNSAAINKVA